MKINEIITEAGLLSRLGQGIKSTFADRKQSQALRKSSQELSLAANDAIKRYNSFLTSYGASGKTITPDIAYDWMSSYLGTKPESKPEGISPQQIRNWVTKELGNYFASKQLGRRPSAATGQQAQLTSVPANAQKSQGTIGALGRRGAGTVATLYQSPLGITVRQASDAGIVLNYKNRNFMLNNRGEWSLEGKDTAGATASGQLQAEMDKVARSTGFM